MRPLSDPHPSIAPDGAATPGARMVFYLPGMFQANGARGRTAALSITGGRCALMCDHCQGKILAGMAAAEDPDGLVERCRRLDAGGYHSVLLSGGCDAAGQLPWERYCNAIARIKAGTGLHVSVHSGLVSAAQARALKTAGVDQALIDVVGCDDTFRRIYHLDDGTARLRAAMTALAGAGLPMVPHIVCGIDYGRIIGEPQAVALIGDYPVAQVVVVGLTPLAGVPASKVPPPAAEDIAEIIAAARRRLPEVPISLGCARRRGDTRLETLAIDAGASRMALPSEQAVDHARRRGLRIAYQRTCCSLPPDRLSAGWLDVE
jgi:lipoyl synthase